MGYQSPIHPLELPDFQGEDGADSLVVRVVSPSAREGGDLNAGRRSIDLPDGTTREETSAEYMHRAMRYLVPKIRYWNLDDADGNPVPLPRDVSGVLDEQVAHLMEQDENIVLAIYHEWRLVGVAKKADTPEGKDSETPSTDGHDASPQSEQVWDVRELERSIPMG